MTARDDDGLWPKRDDVKVIRAHKLALGVVGMALLSSPALACMPGGLKPSGQVKGEACSMTQNVDQVEIIGLGKAEDMGAGIVVQRAYESNGCASAEYLVVMSCGDDTATIIGKEFSAVMDDPSLEPTHGTLDKIQAWVRKAAMRKMALTPDMVAAEARKLGLEFDLRVKASGKIKMTGKRVSLACGCKTYYPGP
jgi:hypothetical protein